MRLTVGAELGGTISTIRSPPKHRLPLCESTWVHTDCTFQQTLLPLCWLLLLPLMLCRAEFIQLLSSEANDLATKDHKSTITPGVSRPLGHPCMPSVAAPAAEPAAPACWQTTHRLLKRCCGGAVWDSVKATKQLAQ